MQEPPEPPQRGQTNSMTSKRAAAMYPTHWKGWLSTYKAWNRGCVLGIELVALAIPVPMAGSGRSANLDHRCAVAPQEPSETEPVVPGSLHPEEADTAVGLRPCQQLRVAGVCCRHGEAAQGGHLTR